MGCGSSREVRPEDAHNPAPPTRPHNAVGITSQTAINTPLSTTTSHYQSNSRAAGPGASASNISTPRTSLAGRRRQQQEFSLTEHINLPLMPPKPWTTTNRTWTRIQLRREREDFFETRVTGLPEIWGALKEVIQLVRRGNLADAQGILDAAGITLPTGRLEEGGVYDERGTHYRLPERIVSDPLNVVDDDGETVIGDAELNKRLEAGESLLPTSDAAANEKLEKGKDAVEKDAIKVRCRLSDRGGPDTIVLIGQTQPVSVLIKRIRSEATVASSARVMIVYFGKKLNESQTLEEQGWQPGHVIQAMVSNIAP